MAPFQQIENPKSAFGDEIDHVGLLRGVPETCEVHNMSSVQVIPLGAAVVWSTNSTDGTGVTITTVAGSPLFAGVAITSASTGQSTDLTSLAAQAAWCTIVVKGNVPGALLTSGTAPGDFLGTVNSTVAGSTGGGYLGPIVSTQVAGAFFGVAGIAFTSGTTGTTPYLTATGPRGFVKLNPQVIPGSTL